MNTSRKRLLPAVLAIVVALVPGAAVAAAAEAEEGVVPPENSAVNQYTESYPTAGGERDVHEHKGRGTSPDRALGARTARKLEQQGRAGREVAELATDTAPVVEPPAPEAGEDRSSEGPGVAGGSDSGRPGGGGTAPAEPVTPAPPVVEPPVADGSSGFGSVVASAFGLSPDGGAGLLLLLMLATLVWALAYASRQRRTAG